MTERQQFTSQLLLYRNFNRTHEAALTCIFQRVDGLKNNLVAPFMTLCLMRYSPSTFP